MAGANATLTLDARERAHIAAATGYAVRCGKVVTPADTVAAAEAVAKAQGDASGRATLVYAVAPTTAGPMSVVMACYHHRTGWKPVVHK